MWRLQNHTNLYQKTKNLKETNPFLIIKVKIMKSKNKKIRYFQFIFAQFLKKYKLI